jgi:Calcineurin-like phosphoesterase
VRQLSAESLTPDVIAVTGDIADRGTAEDYAEARRWFDQGLLKALPARFPRHRLLLVPGNHDACRAAVKRVARALQTDLLASRSQEAITQVLADPDERRPLLARHEAYLEFVNAYRSSREQLVGSCRTGFSIAPTKRYREAKPNSDLDVAIVSQERFDHYWDDVFAYSVSDSAWKQSKEYKHFVRILFHGWIEPRGLPNVSRFEQATRWADFFDTLMQSRQFGQRRISVRLYRTWSRLEAYQEKAVRQCIANLGGHHA